MKRILLFLMMFAVATTVSADKYSKWIDEDVKVLITTEEREAFKKLTTEEQKEKFIQDFWAKRDPSANTPENEFKAEYERRLQFVNDKLKGGRKKPVDTDMGQTLLLLGTSSEQKVEKSEPPKQTWIYKEMPKEMFASDFEIQFEGDPDHGGFKFSDARKAKEILDQARNYHAQLAKLAAATTTQQPAQQQQAPSTAAVPAQPPVTDPALKTALDATAAGNAPKDVAIDVAADSFMTSTGQVFASVAVSGTAEKVGIRVLDASKQTVKEFEMPFTSGFMTSFDVPPGDHNLAVAVTSGGKSGAALKPLNVPAYGDKLAVSSLIFVKDFQQVEAKPEKEPYAFGQYKLVPSFDHSFPKADEPGLRLLYEVYNFQLDPATNQPNLEVVTAFQKGTDKPKQTAPQPVKGFVVGKKITIPTSYPLGSFPPGDYKITLTVTDKISNQTASREGTFTVK